MTAHKEAPSDTSPRIRVWWINPPLYQGEYSWLIIYGLGSIAVYAGTAVAAVFLAPSLGLNLAHNRALFFASFVVLPALAVAVWNVISVRRKWATRGPQDPIRVERLRKIVEDERGPVRLPHRCVEWLVRTGNDDAGLIDLMPRLQPGHVVVCGVPPETALPEPVPADLRFEPTELARPSPQLSNLVLQDAALREAQVPKALIKAQSDPDLHWVRRSLPIVLFLVLSVVVCGLCIRVGNYGVLAAVLFIVLFRLRHWLRAPFHSWLVPGGLLFREGRRLSSGGAFHVAGAESSSLVIFHRSHCVVCNGESAFTFTLIDRGWWATAATWGLLAGWLSTAPRPTNEQLEAFLDSAPRPKKSRS